MQTALAPHIRDTPVGKTANSILRRCVHCGFCLATCPTYQLFRTEADSPRGRIYLIKQLLEGRPGGSITLTHLDRCLTCRSCETTCPSGVNYSELLEIGRAAAEGQHPRGPWQRLKRRAIQFVFSSQKRNRILINLLHTVRPVLPQRLGRKIPAKTPIGPWPALRHERRMLVVDGCVQPAFLPNINAATARVLDKLGISPVRDRNGGCCGAMSQHMNEMHEARRAIRANIDAWWPLLESGCEAIVSTASGCGVTIKEYARIMLDDPEYVDKARKISHLTRDISEILANEDLSTLVRKHSQSTMAFHAPCSLQHGQKLTGNIETLLGRCGVQLSRVRDAHLCCGSAGTYSLLQPAISKTLRDRKLNDLDATAVDTIVTANIGCLMHLQSGTATPVRHWIEMLDPLTANP